MVYSVLTYRGQADFIVENFYSSIFARFTDNAATISHLVNNDWLIDSLTTDKYFNVSNAYMTMIDAPDRSYNLISVFTMNEIYRPIKIYFDNITVDSMHHYWPTINAYGSFTQEIYINNTYVFNSSSDLSLIEAQIFSKISYINIYIENWYAREKFWLAGSTTFQIENINTTLSNVSSAGGSLYAIIDMKTLDQGEVIVDGLNVINTHTGDANIFDYKVSGSGN